MNGQANLHHAVWCVVKHIFFIYKSIYPWAMDLKKKSVNILKKKNQQHNNDFGIFYTEF